MIGGDTANAALNYAGNALKILGLDNWQLSTASFNGINFTVAMTPGSAFNPNDIPFSGAYDAYESLTGNSDIPFGTSLGTYSVTDSCKAKNVVHPLVNYNGSFIQPMGVEGEKFTLEVIFFGLGYQVLLQKALVGILNINKTVIPENLNVLVHPVRGVINNCFYDSHTVQHSSGACQAARLTINFITDYVPTTTNESTSTYAKLYEKIQEISTIVAAMSSGLSYVGINFLKTSVTQFELQFYTGGSSEQPYNVNPLIRQRIGYLNDQNYNLSQTLLSCVYLVYKYIKPSGFSDFYLDSLTVDISLLPPLFNYIQMLTDTEVSQLISYYIDQVNFVIDQYEEYNLELLYPTRINELKTSIVYLTQFSELLLELNYSQYTTYVVPNLMSIRQVLFNLGLDFNKDLTQFLVNNRNAIISCNHLPKGTVLKIRALDA